MSSFLKEIIQKNNVKKESSNDNSSLQETIVNRSAHIIHLTHCDLDAAGSDAICKMVFLDDVITFFSTIGRSTWYLSQIANCNGNGDTIIISDISYQSGIESQIMKLHAAGWKVQWYDHHMWSEDEMNLIRPYVAELKIDTKKCATGVMANKFLPNDKHALEIARVVCDYDLGKWEDPQSSILAIVASEREYIPIVRDEFARGGIINDDIIRIYHDIEQKMNSCIDKSLKSAKIYKGKYTIAVVPAYGYPTETADAVRKKLNSDIELLIFDTGRFSIRSIPPISQQIAKKFGGGGHPNASGGNFNYLWWEKLMFKLFGRTPRVNEFISVAENQTNLDNIIPTGDKKV